MHIVAKKLMFLMRRWTEVSVQTCDVKKNTPIVNGETLSFHFCGRDVNIQCMSEDMSPLREFLLLPSADMPLSKRYRSIPLPVTELE
jgi:hypothetical protein